MLCYMPVLGRYQPSIPDTQDKEVVYSLTLKTSYRILQLTIKNDQTLGGDLWQRISEMQNANGRSMLVVRLHHTLAVL